MDIISNVPLVSFLLSAANPLLFLLICVGAAAALLMLFAIVMKIALKRGQGTFITFCN